MEQILLNICLTAIALCLFKMLIPENSMKKQTDFLVACFFLAALALFFSNGGIDAINSLDFSSESTPYVDFTDGFERAQKQAVGAEIRSRIEPLLGAEGIYPEEIYTIVNISDKYSISINEIRLVFLSAGDDDMETLKKAIHITQKEVGDDILVSGEFKQ